MRCDSRVYKYKGNGKQAITISPEHKEFGLGDCISPSMLSKIDQEDYIESCDGEVSMIVIATDEPYFGGSSAVLEISTRCSKCGQTYFGKKLPTTPEELNVFLANVLKTY